MVNENLMIWSGTEVFNTERLAKYLSNGIVPEGAAFDVDTCEGLAEALYGNTYSPYTTPLQDEPPWFDAANPDTWEFAGLLPLEVTGLDDSTRTVEVIPTLSGDGLPGRVNRTPRTVGVTALLVGKTTEAVYAGLAWLERVLHGECDSDEQPCGPSGTLEFFTTCPTPLSGSAANTDVTRLVDTINNPNAPADPSSMWSPANSTFVVPYNDDEGTILIPLDLADVLDAGESDTVAYELEIDGGPGGGVYDYLIGGLSNVEGSAVLGSGPFRGCNDGPVTIEWNMHTPNAGLVAVVQLVLLDDAGNVAEFGPKVDLAFDSDTTVWDLPFGVDVDLWRPGILVHDQVVVVDVTVRAYPLRDPLDCLAPYRRFLPLTTTTSGPKVVDIIDTGCVTLLRVEWVWVSGKPYRYSVTDNVLTGLGWGHAPSYAAPGVTYDDGGGAAISATPWNCAPLPPVASCAIDPLAPTFGTPPAAPVIVDPLRPRITTQAIRSVWANIGPEQIPANEGVLSLDLVTDSDPIVGARVRVYDTADAAGTIPDLCDFAYEFLIDYIPADATLTIDGPSGQITTLCGGNPEPEDSSAGVRGAYGGPVMEPVVRCDRRYLVFVQWLNVYPRTAVGVYTSGDTEGSILVNAYLTTREG
jgi:hypothetical protein